MISCLIDEGEGQMSRWERGRPNFPMPDLRLDLVLAARRWDNRRTAAIAT